MGKYGKRRQISFRIGPLCEDRLDKAAALFNLKPSQYVKALLYKDLGVFNEPLDMRRRTWKRQQREAEEEEALIIATHENTKDQQDLEDIDIQPGRDHVLRPTE